MFDIVETASAVAGSTVGVRDTVIVVGAGPVGLLTAIELAREGLHPIVLEAKDEIGWTSRAICISRRSQEILDRAGAGAAFAAKALPWTSGSTFHRDRLVFRLEMPHSPTDRHAPFVNLQQSYTERFLLDTLHAVGGADIRWGSRVEGLVQDDDGVTLTVAGPDGPFDLRAGWVVAADGGRSAIREHMGLDLKGKAYESRYLIADIEVDGADLSVERRVWFDPASNPGSTVIIHVQPDRVWRIDYQLRDDEDAEEALNEDNVRIRLQAQLDMMGVSAPWRMIWRSVYKALALSLDSYRHGRVLFAGDAAHLVPIFGVRGLNSGIDDAHNLGWKLAMVVRGDAPETLLDTFSHERRRATRENHAQATKSTWFMSPPGPGFRRMRDAALVLAAGHAWASALVNPRQSSAHTYDDSPGVTPDATPCAEGVRPGEALPNAPLPFAGKKSSFRHLHDALPRASFVLLAFVDFLPGGEAALDALLVSPALRPLVIGKGGIDDDGTLAARFAASRFPLYLLRPDEHVAARFPVADSDAVARALARALRGDGCFSHAGAGTEVTHSGMEQIFEALSVGINGAGAGEADILARVALLLAERLGDPSAVLDCIAHARRTD